MRSTRNTPTGRAAALVLAMATLVASGAPAALAEPVRPFIVGGHDAPAAHPWMVSLQATPGEHTCGGTLIDSGVDRAVTGGEASPAVVLTAGHCAPLLTPGASIARVGSLHRTAGGTAATIAAVRAHPAYDPDRPGDDLAVVVLERAVPQRAALLSPTTPTTGTATLIAGWGRWCEDADGAAPHCRTQLPERLQQLETVVQDTGLCDWIAPTGELCTRAAADLPAMACNKDSGGPQVLPLRLGWRRVDVLVGVTSRDGDPNYAGPRPCSTRDEQGRPGYGVWTDVATHRRWLLETAGRMAPGSAARLNAGTDPGGN
ncbi:MULTISPECIES: trypsin-like serine protease [Actinosynnema]|uniref:S1 family peptidase n=1 Tax=Actinosynnema TaxID=40566 RepID=UPI0020A2D19C|nr:trypsin-like serine protease [Actinosynnema pretiosum]MCP2097420.1 Trypsin [Actinosynnema pretiosum]